MKKVVKQKTIYCNVYIANDGTEFSSEDACKLYENKHKDSDCQYCSDGKNDFFLKIENKEELVHIGRMGYTGALHYKGCSSNIVLYDYDKCDELDINRYPINDDRVSIPKKDIPFFNATILERDKKDNTLTPVVDIKNVWVAEAKDGYVRLSNEYERFYNRETTGCRFWNVSKESTAHSWSDENGIMHLPII